VKFYSSGSVYSNHGSDEGLFLVARNDANLKAKLDSLTFAGNGSESLLIESQNSSDVCVELTNSTNDDSYSMEQFSSSSFVYARNNNTGTDFTSAGVTIGNIGDCGL
jgi:hypothetical protein